MNYTQAFRNHPDVDDEFIATVEETLEIMFDDEVPVGARLITEASDTYCQAGCLAPGSSPHMHTHVTGYMLVTNKGLYEYDLDGLCQRATALHSID